MKNIVIVAESGSDINQELAEQYDIAIYETLAPPLTYKIEPNREKITLCGKEML